MSESAGQAHRPRVVILGGGFAGTYTAMALERLFKKDEIDLVLVSRENFLLFTPMLHEVAASDVDVTHVVSPLRQLLRHGTIFNGDVVGIDSTAATVTLVHASGGHQHTIGYDQLVVALGSTNNFFGLPGVAERAFPMKSLSDAVALRNRAIDLLEQADFEASAGEGQCQLSFVVAGGGFAGVETAGALNDFVRDALEHYPHLKPSDVTITLVHPGSVLLPELSESLGRYCATALQQRGIKVALGTSVASVDEAGVHLSDGTTVPMATLVWTAGTSAHAVVKRLPWADGRGRIPVSATLAVPGCAGIWAAGDAAVVPDPTGQPYPPTAQHAIRQAKVLAANIRAALRGQPLRPFVFATLGQLATIGRRSGVASILGLQFSGFIAWFLWRGIYLSKLPGFERKIRVAVDWALDLVLPRDLVRLRAVEHSEPVPPPSPLPAS